MVAYGTSKLLSSNQSLIHEALMADVVIKPYIYHTHYTSIYKIAPLKNIKLS